MPSVQLVDERAVRLTFSNFSGTVLFEALPRDRPCQLASVVPALTDAPSVSRALRDAPPVVPGLGEAPSVVPALRDALSTVPSLADASSSYPCSQPPDSFEDHHMANGVRLPHFTHQYLQLTPRSSPSPPASPLAVQQPLVIPLPPSTQCAPSSEPLKTELPSQLSQQLPASQPPEAIATQVAEKIASQPHDMAEKQPKGKPKHTQKRSLPLPKVEDRGAKQGKRVRFDDNPVVLSSPQKHAPKIKVTTPWGSLQVADGNLPSRRWGATLSKLDDENFLLLGGESELSGFFECMSLYKAKENRWVLTGHDVPPMPDGGRAWHTTCVVDGNLLVFGGEKQVDGERVQTNDLLVYDTSYFSWYPPSYFGLQPSARAGHCASRVPRTRSIVVYGGINGKRWLNDLFVLEDMCSWKKIKPSARSARPSARSYATLTPASGFLVLFGGNNKTKCFNDIHFLSTDSFVWSEVTICGRIPKPRTGHCAVPSKNGKNVIIYGGWDDQGLQRIFFSDVWELRIKSATECMWVCLFHGDQQGRTPGPRAGASMCVGSEDEDDAIMFGGWHQLTYYNDLTKLSIAKKISKST
ncbi:hypothetical protein FGB62_4g15 [Gracilaria domingensis]|nr:hypothetical protein FGB62_4g15 [Gracilaria domingensis]